MTPEPSTLPYASAFEDPRHARRRKIAATGFLILGGCFALQATLYFLLQFITFFGSLPSSWHYIVFRLIFLLPWVFALIELLALVVTVFLYVPRPRLFVDIVRFVAITATAITIVSGFFLYGLQIFFIGLLWVMWQQGVGHLARIALVFWCFLAARAYQRRGLSAVILVAGLLMVAAEIAASIFTHLWPSLLSTGAVNFLVINSYVTLGVTLFFGSTALWLGIALQRSPKVPLQSHA